MEKITEQEEKLLINYLDGELTETERKRVEDKINQSEVFRRTFNELKRADTLLIKNQRLAVPSKNFTSKVLQNLGSYNPNQLFISKNGLFLLAGIIVAIGITSILLSYGRLDMLDGSISLQTFNPPKNFTTLPTVNFPGKLIVNIILIATTAISFIVLDRTVLRPLFARRAGGVLR